MSKEKIHAVQFSFFFLQATDLKTGSSLQSIYIYIDVSFNCGEF